jgi:hypothetical protein
MPYRPNGARPLAFLATALLSACAVTMQPVADFGGAAGRLATAYKPFAGGIADSCEQALRTKALGNPGAFDAAAAERDAGKRCKPLKEAGATAALFAQAVSDYAAGLTKLAGVKPTRFDTGIRAVTKAAAGLETRDGDAIFSSHQIGAATKLARAAAAMVLAGRLHALTRQELADNQEPLRIVVEAMKTYADAIYAPQLRDTHALLAGELERLVAASNAPTQADVEARLPWRYAQATLRAELAANELESRRVAGFGKSADALVAAHATLIENFDKLGGAERLALVSDFVDKVQAISDDVDAS